PLRRRDASQAASGDARGAHGRAPGAEGKDSRDRRYLPRPRDGAVCGSGCCRRDVRRAPRELAAHVGPEGVRGFDKGAESVAEPERLICASAELVDSGRGARFEVEYFGEAAQAFVVRKAGKVHGYLNRCAHVAMELDWQEGVFFDSQGRDLLCSTHGATYATASGRCVGGPCNGTPMVKPRLEERDGMIYYIGFADD